MKIKKKSFIILKKSYNKTIIDFNFGRHENLSTFKSDIYLGLAASVNIIEVNNCIMVDTCHFKHPIISLFVVRHIKCRYSISQLEQTEHIETKIEQIRRTFLF